MKKKNKIFAKIGRPLPESDVGYIPKFISRKVIHLSFSSFSTHLRWKCSALGRGIEAENSLFQ